MISTSARPATATDPALRGKYAIAGVGESERWKATPLSLLGMAMQAAHAALRDAAMGPGEIDFVLSYTEADTCSGADVATHLGIPECPFLEVYDGGMGTEGLVATAVGLMEAGLARRVLLFRSMRGRSGKRFGGGSGWSSEGWASLLSGGAYMIPHGISNPGQRAGLFATRHLYEAALTEEVLGHICVALYGHAQQNPKAVMYGKPLTLEKYLATPYIASPLRIHDFCVETDEANAMILAPAKDARKPVSILAVAPKLVAKPAYRFSADDPLRIAGFAVAERLYASAGISPKQIDIGAIYDCFSWVVLVQLEAFGLIARRDLGEVIASGALRIGGSLPINTAGGMLSEGYTHGMNNVIELVRQLRGEYAGTERQVEGCELGLVTGWGSLGLGSGMILGAA